MNWIRQLSLVHHDDHHAHELQLDSNAQQATTTTTTTYSPIGMMIGVCFFMFLGAFLSGQLGRGKRNSPKELVWLNVFGVGLLLGTALGIIIPEGVSMIFESEQPTTTPQQDHPHNDHATLSNEVLIGWTLIFGFLAMMFVDHTHCFSSSGSSHSHSHGGYDHITAATAAQEMNGGNAPPPKTNNVVPNYEATIIKTNSAKDVETLHADACDDTAHKAHSHSDVVNNRRTTVSLGLIIHNCIDGIALGAAKAASRYVCLHNNNKKSKTMVAKGGLISNTREWTSMQTLILWAIMIHHVPAAFGFATFLRSTGHAEDRVQKDLIYFSIAGPITALLTFLILSEDFFGFFLISHRIIGCCLLFSGGTFLYVATVHTFDEAKRNFPNGVMKLKHLFVLSVGACLPLVLTILGGHGH